MGLIILSLHHQYYYYTILRGAGPYINRLTKKLAQSRVRMFSYTQVTIYRRHRIGRGDHLDQSDAYTIYHNLCENIEPMQAGSAYSIVNMQRG